jgi:hypothetical protein
VKRALLLLVLVACSKQDKEPDPKAGCKDASDTLLIRLNARDRDDLRQMLVDGCARGDVDEACLYTAKTEDEAVRCIERQRDRAH